MSGMDAYQQLMALIQDGMVRNQQLRRRISALEAEEHLRRAGRRPRIPVEFRSQYGEDALLWDFFAGQLDGFFIEVGAFDGYTYSVSYAFECIGWNGLLVEAIPERFAECVKRRPHSRVVHAALSRRGSAGTAEFTVTEDHFGGMCSYLHPVQEHVESEPVKASKRRTVRVPLTTMNDLLADHKGEIDFASIDVEGAELLLLDGFDLDRYKPKMVLLEDSKVGTGDGNPLLLKVMEQRGYKEVSRLAVNRLFARSDLAPEWFRRTLM
jgi:FkbM family methyltransferase